MRVHLFNTSMSGGAARAALRLQEGLIALDVDSRFYNSNVENADRQVAKVSYSRPTLPSRAVRRIRRFYKTRSSFSRSSWDGKPGCELLSSLIQFHDLKIGQEAFDCDIVNLHWVSNFVDVRQVLERMSGLKPIVWTLHDMRPMTGACHYNDGCTRFRDPSGCHSCPQLLSSGPNDVSRLGFEAMRETLSRLEPHHLTFVAPSKWLVHEARQSSLLGRFPLRHIPYGLDTDVFYPVDRQAAREALGIPKGPPIVLYVADSYTQRRKGYHLLSEAIHQMAAQGTQAHFITIGHGQPVPPPAPISSQNLGVVSDDRLLRIAYSAADLVVVPSIQDNLPNVVLESLACGTPVAAFPVGGIPDLVLPDTTGWLAEQISGTSLAITIQRGLASVAQSNINVRENCRELVESHYTLRIQAKRYIELFEELLSARKSLGLLQT